MKLFTAFLLLLAMCIIGKSEGGCNSPFITRGYQVENWNVTKCAPFQKLKAHMIEICRDRCVYSETHCKSFSFNCGPDSSYDCYLYKQTNEELGDMIPWDLTVVRKDVGCIHEQILYPTVVLPQSICRWP